MLRRFILSVCQKPRMRKLARPPTVVKMDVEGGEIEVLQGARVTLARHHPVLVIEAHSAQAVSEIREFLRPYRYTVEVLGGNGEKAHLYCVYCPWLDLHKTGDFRKLQNAIGGD